MLQPLTLGQVDRPVAAATTPATRLILALAAVHGARAARIANLMLDDVDLGTRRLTVAGRARPLDDLILLLDWLEHRRRRWPTTAKLHLLSGDAFGAFILADVRAFRPASARRHCAPSAPRRGGCAPCVPRLDSCHRRSRTAW
ncbi:hypothetical protein [Streptomyces flaveolus]|uniref:hypothetical protein n=1 Tax=Streptomyces flaveolus TaxID=67297 RepID=UPI00340BFC0C